RVRGLLAGSPAGEVLVDRVEPRRIRAGAGRAYGHGACRTAWPGCGRARAPACRRCRLTRRRRILRARASRPARPKFFGDIRMRLGFTAEETRFRAEVRDFIRSN